MKILKIYLGSNNSKKMGILNSGDPLYSDRSISNNEESIKSKNKYNYYYNYNNKQKLSMNNLKNNVGFQSSKAQKKLEDFLYGDNSNFYHGF